MASASALSARGSKPTYDIWLKISSCRNLDAESEPYLYAGIDNSNLPGTTKYVESGVGKVSGLVSTDIDFAPDNVVFWAAVPNPKDVKLETYIYGKDAGRLDDQLGSLNLKLKKVPGDCVPEPIRDQTVDSDLFSRDATCDFEVAVCSPGKIPVGKDGKPWKATGPKASYSKGF